MTKPIATPAAGRVLSGWRQLLVSRAQSFVNSPMRDLARQTLAQLDLRWDGGGDPALEQRPAVAPRNLTADGCIAGGISNSTRFHSAASPCRFCGTGKFTTLTNR